MKLLTRIADGRMNRERQRKRNTNELAIYELYLYMYLDRGCDQASDNDFFFRRIKSYSERRCKYLTIVIHKFISDEKKNTETVRLDFISF